MLNNSLAIRCVTFGTTAPLDFWARRLAGTQGRAFDGGSWLDCLRAAVVAVNRPGEPVEPRGEQGGGEAWAANARALEAQLDALPFAVAHEYREARRELATLGLAFAEIGRARDEQTAIALGRAIRSRVVNVGVRWLRAGGTTGRDRQRSC
jgi:hypothetical protein